MAPLCFLDMDGVLTDFVSAACEAHERDNPYNDPRSYGIFDMDKLWGIAPGEFWKPLDFDGFWRNMRKLPDADELVDKLCFIFGCQNICILSSPSLGFRCIPEKMEWVRRNYPKLAKNMLFGSAKRFLAGPNRILIDDRDLNIINFEKAGGIGIIFPQLWNSLQPLASKRITHVIDSINIAIKEDK